jgi:hypothetical protein
LHEIAAGCEKLIKIFLGKLKINFDSAFIVQSVYSCGSRGINAILCTGNQLPAKNRSFSLTFMPINNLLPANHSVQAKS